MKFDGNTAWQRASAAVSANREVVLALAGVFLMLPTLALALVFPAPAAAANASTESLIVLMTEYYRKIAPFALPLVLFQAAGTLALLTLLTDRSRPTVGQAIGLGLRGVIPYVLAQLILWLGIGFGGGLLNVMGGATGVEAIAVAGAAATIAFAVYAAIRTSLAGPVIVVEGVRNPVKALLRSWQLSRGNTGRIGLFYLLIGIAFVFVFMTVTLVAFILFGLLASQQVQKIAQLVISSGLQAVMALYFVAVIAAVHRQLAGPSTRPDSDALG